MKLFKNTMERVYPLLTTDIGIDLGTANTLLYIKGKGVILNEPSIVAINKKTGQVVAVGKEAREMMGRTPQHIEAVRPLVEGVISDYEISEQMMAYLMTRAREHVSGKLIAPRVIVGVPSGVTNVERRSVRDAAKAAGARKVYLVEEPIAAAVGIKLPVHDPVGTMIIDIGGGTSDIAVMSLGGLVASHDLKLGGDHFDADIVNYVRKEFQILIGEKTAEELKMTAGYVLPPETPVEVRVKGRDLVSGLPKEVIVTDEDVRQALSHSISVLTRHIKKVLEETPPEIASDILERGAYLVGGGAYVKKLDEYLEKNLNIPIFVAPDPMTAVARGAGAILEDLERYSELLLSEKEEQSF